MEEGDNGQQGKDKPLGKEIVPTKKWVKGTFKKHEKRKEVSNKD